MTLPLLGLALCLCAAPALSETAAGEHYADRDGALGVAKGAAASAIKAAIMRADQACTGMDFKPRRCALSENALNADVHYGVVASGIRLAFVSVRWQSDPTGNAVEAKGLVFVAAPGSEFRFLGAADIRGDHVADVRFEPERITYETRYLRPKDARASPTGRRRYELPFSAGSVGLIAIQRTGHGGPAPISVGLDAAGALKIVRLLYEAGEDYTRIIDVPQSGITPEKTLLSPSLAAEIKQAFAFGGLCNVYDGDPRVGGAQGTEGLYDMRYAIDAGRSTADRIFVNVSVRQRANRQGVNRMTVTMVGTAKGWLVDEIAKAGGGEGYRAALRQAYERCRRATDGKAARRT